MADLQTVLLERRLFEERRRAGFRRGPSRRKLVIVGVLLALLAIGAGWVVGFSDLLAARRVEVVGAGQLAPVQVREAAQVPLGRPLARIDLSAVRERVSALPQVAAVRVSRAWPHGVRIAITERIAVAVVPRGDGFRGLSADGVLFRSYASRPPGLPVVADDQGADRTALREAALVVGSLSADLLGRVDHVTVRTADAITLVLRSGRQVIWGNASDSAHKAEVLAVLLRQKSSVVDLSVPGRPAVRP